ncbi:hypothetical protein [Aquimarina sp. BL5]|uniref:hypothetical protein n=1 Tax=Aquimarina sp. BL5 TaxID=1714860 RepID=UPI00131400FE
MQNTNIQEPTEIIFALIDSTYYQLQIFTKDRKEYKQQVVIYTNHIKQMILDNIFLF